MIDFDNSRWSQPHVAMIVGMVVTDKEEIMYCESPDGERYELVLSGTNLQGYVVKYLSLIGVAGDGVPLWAEFGLLDSSELYIELLFALDEFDQIPRNAEYKQFESEEGYRLRKQTHLVPASIYDGGVLYYGHVY